MARVKISAVTQPCTDASGNRITGASVVIKERNSSTLVPVYDAATGGVGSTAARLTTLGYPTGYVEEGSYDRHDTWGATTLVEEFEAVSMYDGTLGNRLTELEGLIVRPESYGALADGTTNDDAAIRAAIDAVAAAGGGVVYFTPGKTYLWSSAATVTEKHGVTLWGYGAVIKRAAGLASPDTRGFGTYVRCDDLRLMGFELDVNNIERYGGFSIRGCERPLVQDVYAYDSNLNASWASFDHYSFLFNRAEDDLSPCVDVTMRNVIAEDVELVEHDNVEGFILDGFVSRRAAGTTAVGWFSVAGTEVGKDITIQNGIIVDPRKRGISFNHETGGPNNSVLQRVKIRNVSVLKLSETGGTVALVALGNAGGSASSGNTYTDFHLENLLIYVDPTVTDMVRPLLYIYPTPGVASSTATTTNGSPNLTLVTPTTHWQNGMTVTGAGIPGGTTIVSGAGTATMVMSANATASAAGVAIAGSTAFGEHNFTRCRIKNVTVVGDAGASEWAVDLRQLNQAVVDGLTVRGSQLGLTVINAKDSVFRNIEIEATASAHSQSGSRGGNRWEDVHVGSSPTPNTLFSGAHTTDAIVGSRAGGCPSVASAAALTLPVNSDVFNVTGTTGITSITATGQAGRQVTLKFADALTVTDGPNLKLAGNFVTTADDVLRLVCDGTNWYEVGRSAN